jgi:hypothetical protein
MDIHDLDWDVIVKRYELTFARQNHDRPLLHLTYPSGQSVQGLPRPTTAHDFWFNFERRIEEFERYLPGTRYACEGFPSFWCNLGPDVLAGFMGCEIEFTYTDTSWVKPRVTDWAAEPPLRFHREGQLWQQMEQFLRLAAARCGGRWLIGSGDLHTNADGLAAIRGVDKLLLDFIDHPDEIKRRLRECHAVFCEVIQAHFDIIHPATGGCNSSWMDATCRGRYAVIQNDFCCMVGRPMFDEFLKDYVELEAAELDHSIYHLDGPGAIQHIESICASPHLDLVQWVPGAGNKPLPEWPDVLRKIQGLGKGLWLYGNAAEACAMMEYLKPEGCMYRVWCGSRAEAEDVARTCGRIYGTSVRIA